MKILGYVIFGMAISYALFFIGEFGLVLLGGSIFGLLLYIAINIPKKSK